MDRLDKILVSQNVGSRKEVQKLIKDGAVCVNLSLKHITEPTTRVVNS